MSENWFYRAFGNEFGPMSLNDLQELASNGTLSRDDEVRPEALTIWIPAKAVRELQDLYQEPESIESESKVTAPTAVAQDEWYYRSIETPEVEVGPLPFDGIIQLARSGRLIADDEVRLGLESKWRRAGSMGRLVAVLPYQTRRRNPAPVRQEEPLEALVKTDAVQDLLDSLPDEPDERVDETETLLERETETPRPNTRKQKTAPGPKADGTDRKTPAHKTKGRKVVAKTEIEDTESVSDESENEQSVSADLQQDVEDQILEELMSGPKPPSVAAPIATSMAVPTPPKPSPIESIPEDSWATTPHVASTSSANTSFNRPTLAPTTRPPVKAFKPARSGPSLGEAFKNPKVLGGLGILAPLALIAMWMMMPESSAADIKAYETLNGLFTELRDARKDDKDGKKVMPIGKKLEAAAKELGASLKKTADSDHPARQYLLWATQTVPTIVKTGLGGETPSEKQAITNLQQAAVALGLKDAPPPVAVADAFNEP